MTSLRKDAFELLENIPEDKLTFIIQIMQGVYGLSYDDSEEREDAFVKDINRLVNKIEENPKKYIRIKVF